MDDAIAPRLNTLACSVTMRLRRAQEPEKYNFLMLTNQQRIYLCMLDAETIAEMINNQL